VAGAREAECQAHALVAGTADERDLHGAQRNGRRGEVTAASKCRVARTIGIPAGHVGVLSCEVRPAA
jgi:hypothetical protein